MTRFAFTSDPGKLTPIDGVIQKDRPIPFIFENPYDEDGDTVYVNGGRFYPRNLHSFDYIADMKSHQFGVEAFEKLARIIGERKPRVVLLDHPTFEVLGPASRKTEPAYRWMEHAIFSRLRLLLPDAEIIQYGVGPDAAEWTPSITHSTVRYRRLSDQNLEPMLDPGARNVWIPAVGQWAGTRNGGFWNHLDFFFAVSAFVRRVDRVIVWFDPSNWRESHYASTMATLCAATGWPVEPDDRERPDNTMTRLLRVLSAGEFDHDALLEVLASLGKVER